jgi:2-dehydropantoate 2-reductase
VKTLIYGAGPIGRWLALRMHQADLDVTLLARNETYHTLVDRGIVIVDGLTGARHAARPKLVARLDPDDHYDLVVVAMQKSGRMAVCPTLAANSNLKNILFLGNDVSGFQNYLKGLAADRILLGFPRLGGGWEGDDLVIMDREKAGETLGEICFGELDGSIRRRTVQIKNLFDAAGIGVDIEKDMDGWLKYHFAFMAPTAGVIFSKGGDMKSVAADREAIHRYCRACREAGDVLRAIGYRRRQPPIFNLYYWLPRWLEPVTFGKLFASRSAEIRFGLHARVVGPELHEMAEEFELLKRLAGVDTPTLDALLDAVPRHAVAEPMEVAS